MLHVMIVFVVVVVVVVVDVVVVLVVVETWGGAETDMHRPKRQTTSKPKKAKREKVS